jgi:hypothetical protein
MERERLTRLVQDAAAVDRGDLDELQALAERFPWFAGAQVLRSVGLHKAGEVLSEETLRKAAAHLPSRTALFDLAHPAPAPAPAYPQPEALLGTPPPPPAEPPPSQPGPITAPSALEVVAPIHNDTAATATAETTAPDAATPVATAPAHDDAPAMAPQAEVAEALPHTEDATPEVPPQDPAAPSDHPPPPMAAQEEEEDPLERQIMESALSHAYDIRWLEADPPQVHATPPRPEPVELPTPRPVVPIAPLQPAGPARCITRHDRLSFTAWLTAADQPSAPPPPTPPAREREVPEAAADWLERPTEKPEPLSPASTPTKKGEVDTRALIDRFIQQQTPLPATNTGAPPPQKAAFFTPQQAAKRSLDDKAGMVTETLARVYAKQGNLPKAIEAYKRLALKYPEKSAYFAALQKELEAQLIK